MRSARPPSPFSTTIKAAANVMMVQCSLVQRWSSIAISYDGEWLLHLFVPLQNAAGFVGRFCRRVHHSCYHPSNPSAISRQHFSRIKRQIRPKIARARTIPFHKALLQQPAASVQFDGGNNQ